jgi:two-component system, oxyanion-binding sensor
MTPSLNIGFVPLLDAALLILAREIGFDETNGVAFQLNREMAWATIRDKLHFGIFDAAHMLAPAAVALSSGLEPHRTPLFAPVTLGLNGNAIVVAPWLAEALALVSNDDIPSESGTASLLGDVARARVAAGKPPLCFGVVYSFSSHIYFIRRWLRLAGLHDASLYRLQIVPPPFVRDTLKRGLIDGFCVGAPWGDLAVRAGAGHLVHPTVEMVPDCPEKVLAFRAEALTTGDDRWRSATRAIVETARWLACPGNAARASEILSVGGYLDTPPEVLFANLTGTMHIHPGGKTREVPRSSRLDVEALEPKREYETTVRGWLTSDGSPNDRGVLDGADAVFRPDLFKSAL